MWEKILISKYFQTTIKCTEGNLFKHYINILNLLLEMSRDNGCVCCTFPHIDQNLAMEERAFDNLYEYNV